MNDLVEPLLSVTEEARSKILEVRANETDPESLALWIEVSGQSGGAFTYDMYFRPLAEAGSEDVVQRHDDLSVVVAAESVDKLVGATLDFTGAGMVMQNPNRPAASPPMGARPPADLSGELPQRVLTVLEEQINPRSRRTVAAPTSSRSRTASPTSGSRADARDAGWRRSR